jgi:hypothetical protein
MIHYLFYFLFSCRMLLLEESLSLLQSCCCVLYGKHEAELARLGLFAQDSNPKLFLAPAFVLLGSFLLSHGKFQHPNYMCENFKDV